MNKGICQCGEIGMLENGLCYKCIAKKERGMTKHTPLPWKMDSSSIPNEVSIISQWSKENDVKDSATFGDYRGSIICSMNFNDGVPTKKQAEANAQFIVTACNSYYELLEACKTFMREWENEENNENPENFVNNLYSKSIIAKICQAIAKAEGKEI